MDFKDSIKQLSERVATLKSNLLTEEATKTALILPFINALGYDIFNPLEVLPEMNCDIGTKKGEKIDYAILRNGEPVILIECKHWEQNLTLHDNQLLRYFHVSKAKFGILTNGVTYRFYTDLTAPNKMDEKPFLEVNMLDLREEQIEELKRFHKTYFDINSILSTANELKYMGELRNAISREFASPSTEFIKYMGKQVYEGQFTQKVIDQFTPLVERSINNYINDLIADRLKAALNNNNPTPQEENTSAAQNSEVEVKATSKVETTVEELEAFYIIKSILRKNMPAERITYRDAQTYFSVFIDDNNRKVVCRLYLNSENNKRITFLDENKKEIHNKIEHIDDIYQYANELLNAAAKYI